VVGGISTIEEAKRGQEWTKQGHQDVKFTSKITTATAQQTHAPKVKRKVTGKITKVTMRKAHVPKV